MRSLVAGGSEGAGPADLKHLWDDLKCQSWVLPSRNWWHLAICMSLLRLSLTESQTGLGGMKSDEMA